MRTMNGVQILTTTEELVEPGRTAVIVIDMQNEMVSEEGGYARSGQDVSGLAVIVPNIQRLLTHAREIGVLVTYCEFLHRNRLGVTLMDGPNIYMHQQGPFVSEIVEGTWEAQTVSELAPHSGDIVIPKSRASAMYHTALDDILRGRGIRSLIVTGGITDGCVLKTAVDATHHGYYSVIIKDCVASYKRQIADLAMAWMETRFPVLNLEEVLSVWQKLR